MNDEMAVLAAMATPTVLLLANAMLILSTNQRLQAILERVRETELTLAGKDVAPETNDPNVLNDLLRTHAKRARGAHRALLCFYSSAGLFVVVVACVGLASLGISAAVTVAVVTAFFGCASLLCGAALLIAETWRGIRATDRRFETMMDLCREMARRAL